MESCDYKLLEVRLGSLVLPSVVTDACPDNRSHIVTFSPFQGRNPFGQDCPVKESAPRKDCQSGLVLRGVLQICGSNLVSRGVALEEIPYRGAKCGEICGEKGVTPIKCYAPLLTKCILPSSS